MIEDHHQIDSFNWDFVPDKYYMSKGAAGYAQLNPEIIDETGQVTTHYPVSHHNSPYAHKLYAEYIVNEVYKRQL